MTRRRHFRTAHSLIKSAASAGSPLSQGTAPAQTSAPASVTPPAMTGRPKAGEVPVREPSPASMTEQGQHTQPTLWFGAIAGRPRRPGPYVQLVLTWPKASPGRWAYRGQASHGESEAGAPAMPAWHTRRPAHSHRLMASITAGQGRRQHPIRKAPRQDCGSDPPGRGNGGVVRPRCANMVNDWLRRPISVTPSKREPQRLACAGAKSPPAGGRASGN
jgi:hypothetical protein